MEPSEHRRGSPSRRSRADSAAPACSTCRARKDGNDWRQVKCDRRQGGCANCERLQLTCIASATLRDPAASTPTARQEAVSSPAAAGTKRKRAYRSCIRCRSSKIRCSGERPACSRCTRRGLGADCQYNTDTEEPSWVQRVASQPLEAPAEQALDSPQGRAGTSTPLAWLDDVELPATGRLRSLLESYFANVHPIRVFAFVHKPSFMRSLDEGLLMAAADQALLFIVSALGARFFALEYHSTVSPLPTERVQNAGKQWAKRAEALLFADYSSISATRLKALVLLHDFEARVGNYAQSFMLTGLITRQAHALQINLERSTDLLCREAQIGVSTEVTLRETNRRLMWACYMIDMWAGSGVDQLTLLRTEDLKLQLPCNERQFLLQIPSVTERLQHGQVLDYLHPEDVPDSPSENLGISAYYVRIINLWQRVLRFVKHLDEVKPPWQPDSEFSELSDDVHRWKGSLPSWLAFTPDNIYIRKESSQLGALFLVHCMYHHALCDLNRIALPQLFKIREQFAFPPEQREVVTRMQTACFEEAQNIATLLSTVLQHGVKYLADPILPSFAYNSSRIMLYYMARVQDVTATNARGIINRTMELVRSNNAALREMTLLYPLAEPLYLTTEKWLSRVHDGLGRGHAINYTGPQDPSDLQEIEQPPTGVDQLSPTSTIECIPDQQLNPLSMFRLTRKTIQGRLEDKVPVNGSYHRVSNTNAIPSLNPTIVTSTSGGDVPELIPAPPAIAPGAPFNPPAMGLPLFDLDTFQNFFDMDFPEPLAGSAGFEGINGLGWMNGMGNFGELGL